MAGNYEANSLSGRLGSGGPGGPASGAHSTRTNLPPSQGGSALPFHLPSKLYEHTSVVITTNLDFVESSSVVSAAKTDSARLDRLTHHCRIVQPGKAATRSHTPRPATSGTSRLGSRSEEPSPQPGCPAKNGLLH
ncbi:ATP-binding protein [Rhizobacter sp. AJA081-3]|uniref:ATP-binding protein n=1 Tax=Rhizobacter sp. AJA081-3 TaxID=2753607 RepID=UPI001ADF5989